MMADNLPFRSDAEAMKSGVRPVGELAPFRERGQTAPGGEQLSDVGPSPDALGTGSSSLPVRLGR